MRLGGPQGAAVHPDTRDAFFALLARMLGQVTAPPVRPTREWHRAGDLDVVVFTAEQLAVPLSAADPSLARVLAGYAETELDKRATWFDQVRASIRADLADGAALRTIAGRLAYSPRTVQQRLAARGTTFSAIVDQERQARALVLLANPALSVTRIAPEVGFTSIEGFSRAVRRWTGTSPTEWRKNQQHVPPPSGATDT